VADRGTLDRRRHVGVLCGRSRAGRHRHEDPVHVVEGGRQCPRVVEIAADGLDSGRIDSRLRLELLR